MAWLRKFRHAVEAPNYDEYIGRAVRVAGRDGIERTITIERCVFNLAKATDIEVEAKGQQYVVNALDFMCQMNGDRRPTKSEIKEFELHFQKMDIRVKEPAGWKPQWAQKPPGASNLWTPPGTPKKEN